MKREVFRKIVKLMTLMLALGILPVCGGSGGGGGGGGGGGQTYTSLNGTWNYTGTWISDEICTEDHEGTATFVEQNGLLKITMHDSHTSDCHNPVSETYVAENGVIDYANKRVLFVETPVYVPTEGCSISTSVIATWTDYQHLEAEVGQETIDCVPAYSAVGTYSFTR